MCVIPSCLGGGVCSVLFPGEGEEGGGRWETSKRKHY